MKKMARGMGVLPSSLIFHNFSEMPFRWLFHWIDHLPGCDSIFRMIFYEIIQ
jgi:hypothetical protein